MLEGPYSSQSSTPSELPDGIANWKKVRLKLPCLALYHSMCGSLLQEGQQCLSEWIDRRKFLQIRAQQQQP